MADLAAWRNWLASRPRNARIEMIPGLFSGRRAEAEMSEPGQDVTYGGYDEERAVYTTPLFAPTDGTEPRTVHLGVDVFAPAGTPVFAPLAGIVHSFADNDRPGDYGPTVILEHRPDPATPGFVFHTLYGHLSRDSLRGLCAGQRFGSAERVAMLGGRGENGGWPPHLHFQVMLEIGSARGDYPGVCRRSERARWLAICPDPAPLMGLAPD